MAIEATAEHSNNIVSYDNTPNDKVIFFSCITSSNNPYRFEPIAKDHRSKDHSSESNSGPDYDPNTTKSVLGYQAKAVLNEKCYIP